MKFSVRDLMFVTVIVALAVGWWLDRANRHKLEIRTAEEIARTKKDRIDVQILEKKLVIARSGLESQQRTIEYLKGNLPNSSAPAPNPTKP